MRLLHRLLRPMHRPCILMCGSSSSPYPTAYPSVCQWPGPALAYQWLESNDDTPRLDVWKLRQRFALACFRFFDDGFCIVHCHTVQSDRNGRVPLERCFVQPTRRCESTGTAQQRSPRELYFLSERSKLNFTNNALEWKLTSDVQFLSNLKRLDLSYLVLSNTQFKTIQRNGARTLWRERLNIQTPDRSSKFSRKARLD